MAQKIELSIFKLTSLSNCTWMSGTLEMETAEANLKAFLVNNKWSNVQVSCIIRPLSKLIANLLLHIMKGAAHQHAQLCRLVSLSLELLNLLLRSSESFSHPTDGNRHEHGLPSLAFDLLQVIFDATMKSCPPDAPKFDPARKPPVMNIKSNNDSIIPLLPPSVSRPSTAHMRMDRMKVLLLSIPLVAHVLFNQREDERAGKAVSILVKILLHVEEGGDQDGHISLIKDLKRQALRSLAFASDIIPEALVPISHKLILSFFTESLATAAGDIAVDLLTLLHLRLMVDRSLSSDGLALSLWSLIQRSISAKCDTLALKCVERLIMNSTRAPRSDTTRGLFSSYVPLLLNIAVKQTELAESAAASDVLSAFAQDDSLLPLLTTSDTQGKGSIVEYIAASVLALSQNSQNTDDLKRSYLRFLHITISSSRLPLASLAVVSSALLTLLATSSSCADSLLASNALLLLITTVGDIVIQSLIEENAIPLIQALIRADPSTSNVGDQHYLTSGYQAHEAMLVGARYEVDMQDHTASLLRKSLGAILDELLVSKAVSSDEYIRDEQTLLPAKHRLLLPPLPPSEEPPLVAAEACPRWPVEDEVIQSLSLNEGDSVQFDQEVLVQGEPMRVVSVVRSVKKGDGSTSYTFEDRVFSVPSTPSGPKQGTLASRPPLPPPSEALGNKVALILQLSSSSSTIRGSELLESPRKIKRRTLEDLVTSALRPSTPLERTQTQNSAETPLSKLKILAGMHLLRSFGSTYTDRSKRI